MQGKRGESKRNGYRAPDSKPASNGVHAHTAETQQNGKNAAVGSYGGTRVSGDRQGVTYTKGWTIVTPFLVFICPIFAMVMSYTIIKLDGMPSKLLQEISKRGLLKLIYKAWIPYIFGSWTAWKFIIPFAVFELILMRVLPGKMTKGPVTPAGNTPIYKANGILAYLTTLATFFLCAYFKIFNPADIYDHFLEIIGALNVVSLIFCLLLVIKGTFFPSSTDCGRSGSFIFDYYWGTELYPRILGWDVKMFTNCRFGMMSWPLLLLSYAAKQYQTYGLSDSMLIAVAIQLVYVTKFFHWEMGYMKTLDIMHDRAGFYLVSQQLEHDSPYFSNACTSMQAKIHSLASLTMLATISQLFNATMKR